VFVDVAKALANIYPHIDIQGSPYPPPPLFSALASVFSFLFFFLIFVLLFGDSVIQLLNSLFTVGDQQRQPPLVLLFSTLVAMLKENRTTAFLLAFLFNFLSSKLIATGAFEVSLDQQLIWSSLSEGRLPTIQQLMTVLKTEGGLEPIA